MHTKIVKSTSLALNENFGQGEMKTSPLYIELKFMRLPGDRNAPPDFHGQLLIFFPIQDLV
jgi:hypothetical protein